MSRLSKAGWRTNAVPHRYGAARVLVAALVLPAVAPSVAQAQTTSVPQSRDQLDIGVRIREPARSTSRVVVEGDIERGPCPLAAPSFAQTRVTFSRVSFPGLKAVDPAVLDDSWREYAGAEQPVSVLCEIRDRAATTLRAMGYLAAVQIPPQRIDKDGEVRMDVLVARLTEVQVRGDAGPNAGIIADHLARLTREPYFNTRVAERQLLLLGEMPGYQVRLTLKPAPGSPGDVTGDVRVERTPFQLFGGIQNLGSHATGREGAFVQVVANGLTGLADRTTVSVFNTLDFSEQTVVQASHDFAMGAEGLRVGASALYAHSKPKPSGALDFRSETVAGQIGLTYPVVRRRAFSLVAGGGLEVVDQDIDLVGSGPLARDHLRVFYGRLNLDLTDSGSFTGRGGYSGAEPRYRLSATLEARRGIDGLGASKDCTPITNCQPVPISNLLADPSAFVLRAQANAEFRPTPTITVAVAPRGQYSPDTLLSYERFSVGNYTVGRGLDPGSLLGDSGLGSSVELRYGRLFTATGNRVALQPFAFLDAAWTWTHDSLTKKTESAYTTGGGLRARWGDRLDADLSLAVPLKRTGFQDKRGDVRLLFTIRARFVPWDPS